MTKSLQNTLEIATATYPGHFAGAIPSSRWTTGSGRHVSKRPTPPYCVETTPAEALAMGGKTAAAVKRLLKVYPKCRKCIVVSDWRQVGKLVKDAERGSK